MVRWESSESINELLRQGLLLYLSGQPMPALDCYDRILEHHPYNYQAMLGKGRALLLLGRREQACRCFARSVGDSQCEPEARFALAVCLLSKGEFGEGIYELLSLHTAGKLDMLPAEVPLPRELVVKAIEVLEQQHAVQPDSGWQLTTLAVMLASIGRKPEAFEALARVLRTRPSFTPALLLRERWLSQSLCLPAPSPDPPPAPRAAPAANLECLPEHVLRVAEELLLNRDSGALMRRALSSARQGGWEEVGEYLRRLMIVEPEHEEGCRLRIEAFLARGLEQEAREECFHLMDRYERQGRIADALEMGALALDRWPEHGRPLLKHVLLFHRLQDVRTTACWALALVDHHRQEGAPNDAAAVLYWLLRKPLPPYERREAQLTLVEVLLDANRLDHAVEQLRAHLRRDGEPCESVTRLLARLPEGWAKGL